MELRPVIHKYNSADACFNFGLALFVIGIITCKVKRNISTCQVWSLLQLPQFAHSNLTCTRQFLSFFSWCHGLTVACHRGTPLTLSFSSCVFEPRTEVTLKHIYGVTSNI